MYKILIVEDEMILRKGLLFSFDFSALDCAVVAEAENGVEGLEKIQTFQPDIVITDITMPKMNGLKMIEESQ